MGELGFLNWIFGRDKPSYPPSTSQVRLFDALAARGLNPQGPDWKVPGTSLYADIAFPDKKLIVEFNGPHHLASNQRRHDKRREFVLREYGWSIMNFDSQDAYFNVDRCVQRVERKLLE